jgi:hypothetical protein
VRPIFSDELLELPEGGLGVDVDLLGDAGELDLDADGGDEGAAGPRVGVQGALLDKHPAGRRLPPRNGRNIVIDTIISAWTVIEVDFFVTGILGNQMM